ncbi:hypothetical protein CAPTEDRAFT_227164 [Capitella teleta]|uniref:Amidase domain-containing protein n=1 Tax=Capitella teleta TaxID=283909 RepID=R7UG68_CAPTE|nr:hypothetical protein CAPTEDRAFT_227164 [Capitella teleta]|eukprot:ELU05205.1 hypothetical protein CAPTEDRAFT_227164 [Capitella teleta]
MLIGEVKSLLRNTLSSTTVQTSGLEKLFAYLDDRWDLPESIEWLRLGLALRDVYLSPRWRAAVVAFGSLVVHGCLYAYMRSCVRGIEFKERRKQRRIDRDEALQVLENELKNLKLSEEEIEHIVSCNVPDLVSKLQSGELLATQVLHAFQWKALSAHKKTNCLTGLVIEAEEWAVALDKLPRDERGPLHGIPISVKENFPLAYTSVNVNQVYKSKRPLKIGVFTFDGFCQPIPACESIVIEASEHLSSLGHEIVEWSPPDPHLAFWYAVSIMSGDGGQSTHKEILNDELSSDVLMLYHVPITLRRIIARVIKPFNPFNSTLLRLSCGVRSVPDWWHLTLRIQEYRQRVISSWKESGLDVIICPSFATPALPLNNEISLHAGNYCMLFNVLNFPAGVVPRGEFSDDDVEEVRSDYPEDTAYQRKIKQCVLQDSVGLPLSVQCVSLPWQEELCLRVMNELET